LKRFGIDVVIAAAGNMRTGGPAKTAAALARVADAMTSQQRELYGQTFGAFTSALNGMQGSGLDSPTAARRVIELAEEVPAPSIAPVGEDAAEILRLVREKPDAEQDALRLRLAGLAEGDSALLPSDEQEQVMIEILDANDKRAVRNKNNVLELYELMINSKRSEEGTAKHVTRPDGSRLRYFTAGNGPPLVLMHTVRTQLDYFQRVIPRIWDHYTVHALDLPGMGWSDIVPGATYEEPELRRAVIEFANGLGLRGATLAGESLGAALALSASIDLKERVSRVVAFNSYDYPGGLERGNWLARFIISTVRLPGIGPLFARLEPRPIMRAVLHGGFVDKTTLPEDFLEELLRSGRREGYSVVARGIYRNLEGLTRARQRYAEVSAPVTLIYSERDWSRPAERDQVARSLANVQRLTLPQTGHFSSLERPDDVARILLGARGAPSSSVRERSRS
jgi:pimeloyl-ACP methyl ester carboxylesterase